MCKRLVVSSEKNNENPKSIKKKKTYFYKTINLGCIVQGKFKLKMFNDHGKIVSGTRNHCSKYGCAIIYTSCSRNPKT